MSELLRRLERKLQKIIASSESPRISNAEKDTLRRNSEANAKMILRQLSIDPIPLSFETDKRAGLLLAAMDSTFYSHTGPVFEPHRVISRHHELVASDNSIVMLCDDGLHEVIQSASSSYLIDEELTGRLDIKSLRGTDTLSIPHETEILIFHDLPATLRKDELSSLLIARGYQEESLNIVRTQFMTTPDKRSFILQVPGKNGEIEERRFSSIDVRNHPRNGKLSYFQWIPDPLSESAPGLTVPLYTGFLTTVPMRA